MVYGEGCKGNYQTLVKIANKFPFFADYKNQRSMIEIKVLCDFVRKRIEDKQSGVFFPQDEEYVCTCKMIQAIAMKNGKDMKLTKILNPFVWALKTFTKKGRKAFGNLVYVDKM
jgi:UDP-glucose 4-epimerase